MAGEEGDSELKDLVAQTLESQGVLGKIRAQLRASVFLALEQQENKEKSSQVVNDRFNSYMQTKDGHLTAGLVREFLQFFELDFTCSVFDPETDVLSHFNGREKLATDLGLSPTSDSPLLLQLLKRARSTPPLIQFGTEQRPLPSSISPATPTFTSSGPSPVLSTTTATTSSTLSGLSALTPVSQVFSSAPILTTSRQPIVSTSTVSSSSIFTHFSSSSSSATTVTSSSHRSAFAVTSTATSSSSTGASGSVSAHDSKSKLLLKSSDRDHTLDGLGLGGGVSSLNPPNESSLKSLLTLKQDSSKKSSPGVEGTGSDDESEEVSGSHKWETSDHSLSQTSNSAIGDFDYTEHIQQ